jgi:sulfur-carrier protein adenylyltransferase/sulfurtransferase
VTIAAGSVDLRRYSRHLLIPEVGLSGQRKLAAARVLCIGAGGLGSPILAYLTAAGVGRIGVVDDDVVDVTNLQRQIVYATGDVGKKKVDVAVERLRALNPQVAFDAIPVRFDASNARELVRLYDVVVDGTDTFASRYLINDACVLERKPDVYGSIFRFDGQVSIFGAGGPCYRCLFPQPPPPESIPTCAEGGVLGVLAGIVGTWQASEALKLILQIGAPLVGRLLLIDALDARIREIAVQRDPDCPLCGDAPSIREVAELTYERTPANVPEIEVERLDHVLAQGSVLLDVREPHEAVLGTIDGALAVPASQLEARLHELDTATSYVVACRVGARSLWAADRMRDAGFGRLYHLRGGLLAYAARNKDFDFF